MEGHVELWEQAHDCTEHVSSAPNHVVGCLPLRCVLTSLLLIFPRSGGMENTIIVQNQLTGYLQGIYGYAGTMAGPISLVTGLAVVPGDVHI